jgi:hypothetical protein
MATRTCEVLRLTDCNSRIPWWRSHQSGGGGATSGDRPTAHVIPVRRTAYRLIGHGKKGSSGSSTASSPKSTTGVICQGCGVWLYVICHSHSGFLLFDGRWTRLLALALAHAHQKNGRRTRTPHHLRCPPGRRGPRRPPSPIMPKKRPVKPKPKAKAQGGGPRGKRQCQEEPREDPRATQHASDCD